MYISGMLFKRHILDGIAQGRITVAFRRWQRPTVKAGGTLKSPVGLLSIESVDVVEAHEITPQAAMKAGFGSVSELKMSLGRGNGSLYRIEFKRLGDDPRIALRENDKLSDEEIANLKCRLDRLDAHSKIGPWTRNVLHLIKAHPDLRAAELARHSGLEKEWLKLNIRKLKNLGLTESLDVGYRLSPRGQALLERMGT